MNLFDTIKSLASQFLPQAKPFGVQTPYTKQWDTQIAQQNQQAQTQQTKSALLNLPDFRTLGQTISQDAQSFNPLPLFQTVGEGINQRVKPNFDAAVNILNKGYTQVGDYLHNQYSLANQQAAQMNQLAANGRKQGVFGVLPGGTVEGNQQLRN